MGERDRVGEVGVFFGGFKQKCARGAIVEIKRRNGIEKVLLWITYSLQDVKKYN